jgi:hypothetical protein
LIESVLKGIEVNKTKILLIAAVLATTASLGFARTPAAPSANSKAAHATKHQKVATKHKAKAARMPATGAPAATQ